MAKPKKKTDGAAKPRRPSSKKGIEPTAVGLGPTDLGGGELPAEVRALAGAIAADGGAALASYREPYGGRWVILAALAIESVEPTPYQRDLSATHATKVANAIRRTGRFLDPIVAVRESAGKYWTPNGLHRREALGMLGGKAIVALVVPEKDVAFEILALNTEKAHNLREKALEVIRMHRALGTIEDLPERNFATQFEEPSFVTLGLLYERRPRFSGGAYQSMLRRCESFFDEPLRAALKLREARASKMEALDDAVGAVVDKLKARGLTSPYLKAFVVGRINPLRWSKDPTKTADFDATVDKMIASTEKLDVDKVRPQDLARSGGPPDDASA